MAQEMFGSRPMLNSPIQTPSPIAEEFAARIMARFEAARVANKIMKGHERYVECRFLAEDDWIRLQLIWETLNARSGFLPQH